MHTHSPNNCSESSAAGKPTTMKDVARAAGVHVTTVSKALMAHDSIPKHTRERIKAMARAMGYEKNEVNQALTRIRLGGNQPQVSPRIGLLIDMTLAKNARAFSELLDGATAQGRFLGHEVLVVGVTPETTASTIADFLERNEVRWLIATDGGDPSLLMTLRESGFCPIMVGAPGPVSGMAHIATHEMHDLLEAHNRLVMQGYAHIGVAINGPASPPSFKSGTRILDELNPAGCVSFETREMLANRLTLWADREGLDAILTNDPALPPLLHKQLPRLAIASTRIREVTDGWLAGVHLDWFAMGQRAVSFLSSCVRPGKPTADSLGEVRILVPGKWVDGASAPRAS